MSNLVIAEHDHGALRPATLNTVTAAAATGDDVHVAVIGTDCKEVARAAANIAGVSKVWHVEGAEQAHFLAENMAPTVVALAESYDRLWAPANTFGKNLMPRVAALLDVQPLSDVTAVVDANTYERPIYAGNAIATVRTRESKVIITVRPTAFEATPAEGGTAPVEAFASSGDSGLSSFVGLEATESDRPDLTAAPVVVSGGRGLGSGENFAMLERLADKLGGAVGASRAAVDAGFVPNDLQVGQTGKVVAPQLYIAVGISGAIQHLAGMKESKVIVAINKDEEAPIFQVADYGLVADLFQAVPELETELNKFL